MLVHFEVPMAVPLRPCPSCAQMVYSNTCTCPHCGAEKVCRSAGLPRSAMLLGLTLAAIGCDDDKGTEEHFSSDYTGAPSYTYEDVDGDGYADDVDCDDSDASIHPDAEEVPGDGVDSNCNADDDT